MDFAHENIRGADQPFAEGILARFPLMSVDLATARMDIRCSPPA
ncbi:MAG: hypothetical protein ACLGH0_15845 [Thermoanaerobaculia bacterium]